ncbi:MAG TPA: hypothetical protein VF740_00580, partial [Candidatus Acidoferrum sp.]
VLGRARVLGGGGQLSPASAAPVEPNSAQKQTAMAVACSSGDKDLDRVQTRSNPEQIVLAASY